MFVSLIKRLTFNIINLILHYIHYKKKFYNKKHMYTK